MQTVPKEWLDFLREQFPKNSRIQLTEMGDDSQSLPTGSTSHIASRTGGRTRIGDDVIDGRSNRCPL